MSQISVKEIHQTNSEKFGTLDLLNKPRLIIIDDELELATLMSEVALSVGFEAEVITSANQFLQNWTARKNDVIVIDLFMPNIDGFELIQLLAERKCSATIILVSGYDKTHLNSATMIAKAKGLNLKHTFTKPFQMYTLKKLFQEVYDENT